MRILIVEDERKLSSYLQKILESEKHEVSCCETAEEALEGGFSESCEFLILDLMLPGQPGEHFLKQLRAEGFEGPVLVLSAKDMIASKVSLLEMGADDYLVKPFNIEELLARVKALQRRYNDKQTERELVLDGLVFYRKQNKVRRGDKEVFLTKKEGDVLAFLLAHRGKVIRTEDILSKVWKARKGYHSNIVQATIRRLRKKIDDGFDHPLIRNVHGVGYMIVDSEKKELQPA